MTSHSRRHLYAWLGILAVCLIVLVPVMSQLLVSVRNHEPIAALCTTVQVDTGVHHTDDPLAACGYCDLLATHAAIPSIPPAVIPVLLLPLIFAAIILSTRFTPLGAFPSGRPRDPPVFS